MARTCPLTLASRPSHSSFTVNVSEEVRGWYSRNMATDDTESPDFRSEKMDSPEGRGIALGRWSAFWYSIPDDVLADAYGDNPKRSIADYDAEVRDDIAEAVLDDSELIGFWVAWHQAGGFAHLESGGWHRATIFRKIRKFRTRYGAHPDEYTFPWIKLDLKRTWSDELSGRLRPLPDPS